MSPDLIRGSRKFNRLFDDRVRNQVNHSLPICVQNPFFPAWRAPVSSTVTHDDVSSPARRTSWASAMNPSWFSFNRRTNCRFEIAIPIERNKVSNRGIVDCP